MVGNLTYGDVNGYVPIQKMETKKIGSSLLDTSSYAKLPNRPPSLSAHDTSVRSNYAQPASGWDKYGSTIASGASMAGSAARASINGSNTEYNLMYGAPSESSEGLRSVGDSVSPVFGIVNAGMSTIGAAMNKNNAYDQDGYNHNEKYGEFYMGMGGFDPAGMAMRINDTGGEGAAGRALLNLVNPFAAGAMQYRYEQEQAVKRKQERENREDDEYKLSQFSFTPNLDV